MCFSTGSLFQYFRPNHNLLCAGFRGTLTSCTCSSPKGWWRSTSDMAYAKCGFLASCAAIFSSSSGLGVVWRRKGFGGVDPPNVTVEMKPSRCRPSMRLTWSFETGTEVRPSRALEAFCMCEHTCARLTRDMVRSVVGCMGRPRGAAAGGERRDQGVKLVLLIANVAYTGCKARQISWWASIEVDAVWS